MNNNTVDRALIESLQYDTSLLYASELPGEDFHPDYKKDKKLFVTLVSTSIKLEKVLKKYFKDLSIRVSGLVNWGKYFDKSMKADEWFREATWEDEVMALQVQFEGMADSLFEMGGLAGLAELNIQKDFSSQDLPNVKALNKYRLNLAKDIAKVTSDRIKASILKSLSLGESQAEAAARLEDIVNNPKRAAMIAHTETVRAYSMGKMQVAEDVGAKYKVWRDGQPGACVICSHLHGIAVPVNNDFPSVAGGGISYAPAHPWCKCLTKLVLDKSFLRDDEDLIEGSEILGQAPMAKPRFITRNGRVIPIGPRKDKKVNGMGYHVNNIGGVSYKHADSLISHEGAPDLGRVESYIRVIRNGHAIAPLLVKAEGKKWGIEDGKHRFEALKRLGHKFIPTVTNHTPAYDKAVEHDNAAINKLFDSKKK